MGLIRLSVAVADYEDEYIEWCRAGEELERELDSLRNYGAVDCEISLAEYSEPKFSADCIYRITQCVLYIPHGENFYFRTTEEAVTTLLEYCIEKSLPKPTQIDYVINGYYVMWKFKEGMKQSELPLWGFIQKVLHERFAEIGSKAEIAQDATGMLYASGFENSSYVGFDLNEKTLTVYSYERLYPSVQDFIVSLPLSLSEIEEYRNTRAKKNSSLVIEYFWKVDIQRSEEIINKYDTKYNTERKKAAK